MLRMTSMSSSIDRHNFTCVTRASVDLIKLPLKDILESKIKPEDLYKKIQYCSCLMQGHSKLRPDQLKMCYLPPPAKPDYREFDASLLYTLIRNLCSLPIPKQKWGKEPHPSDTQISDDVERLRLFRNIYYAHAKSSSIPEATFERIWNELRDTIDRIQSKVLWTVNYERELSKIERDKSEIQNLETYKAILEFYKQFQPENRDEADIYIKGDDKIICGGIARLEANIRGQEPLCWSTVWQKQKNQVFEDIDTSNEKYSGSAEKILIIQSVCKEDAGKYQAIITLNGSDLKHSAEFCLHVLGDPPCLNQLEVILGENEITLLCSYMVLDNSPKVHQIEWRRNDKILDQKNKTFSRDSVNESVYKITSPTKADIGQYTCTLVNAVGSVSKHVLFDIPCAKISVHPKKVYLGSKITIKSEVFTSNPLAEKSEWQKCTDGDDFHCIDITESKYYGSKLNTNSPVLVIVRADSVDKLYYRLVIWNKFGESASNTVDLTKISGGDPLVYMQKSEDKETGRQTFTVTIESAPSPCNIQWTAKGINENSFKPIDCDADEYKGSTNSLPHPVLVLKKENNHKDKSFQIEVENLIGRTTKNISDCNKVFSKTFAQDVTRCAVCRNFAESYCKPCDLTFCWNCQQTHSSDRNHRRVEIQFTECMKHDNYNCEIYCKDCEKTACSQCVTDDHKQHHFISLEFVLNEKKTKIKNKIQEIKSIILPKFQTVIDKQEYEDQIKAISVQEDIICKITRENSRKYKDQVTQNLKHAEEQADKNALTVENIKHVVQKTDMLLERNDPKEILEFKEIKCQFPTCPLMAKKNMSVFKVKTIQEEDIQALFGTLVNKNKEQINSGENLINEIWFHGFIPETEANELMKENGDFLVRKRDDCYIISTYHTHPFHFKVTSEIVATRVGPKATLCDLIDHLVTSGEPLSNSNPSILKFPIDRSQYQLDCNQITFGPKIENTNRNDMMSRGFFGKKLVLLCKSVENENRLFKNVRFLRLFDNPNIVHLEGYSLLRKPVLIVLEDMGGGQLLGYLRSKDTLIPSTKRIEMCYDVAKGMTYLHQHRMVHRDLAARSCLVTESGIVKIYDFWMAEKEDECQKQNTAEQQLVEKWTAPETLMTGKFTLMSDVWSFGILMWEIFSMGKPPYDHLTNKETKNMLSKGQRMDAPTDTPEPCYKLMLRCWEKSSAQRRDFKEIVKKLQKLIVKIK